MFLTTQKWRGRFFNIYSPFSREAPPYAYIYLAKFLIFSAFFRFHSQLSQTFLVMNYQPFCFLLLYDLQLPKPVYLNATDEDSWQGFETRLARKVLHKTLLSAVLVSLLLTIGLSSSFFLL